MGTRHRAALALPKFRRIAIVVSEETGIISMAKNGVLIRILTARPCIPVWWMR